MSQLFDRLTAILNRLRAAFDRLWATDKPLTGVGLLMVAVAVPTTIGLLVDPRTIGGAPAWLKPLKFAVSTAIYSFTLAWVFRYLTGWVRTRRIVGWTTAVVFVLEVALIGLQAWRGTTSHFNIGTPLDALIFSTMGAAILIQTIVSIWVAVALWRQPFADAAIGWALRLGMTITIVGAASGGLMTRPTAEQLAEARATHRIAVAGAHTVGAPDGGSGLPGTGWSREHGDLRVPHFLGLHALQLLALAAVALRRRRVETTRRSRLMLVGGVSYATLFAILIWQALRGEALVQPGSLTLTVGALWALATAVATALASSWKFSAASAGDAALSI